MINSRALFVCISLFGIACPLANANERGTHDRAFDTIPFANWVAGQDSAARIRWSAQVLPARLSFHQRLAAAVSVTVDGAELARRRGKGEFVVFAQFTDASGSAYQSHSAVDLTRVEEGLSASNVSYSIRAFVLPGEYRLAILLLDSASQQHWSKTENVKFPTLKHDPLPDSWKDLPAVQFVPVDEPPQAWFLPELTDRLYLPSKTNSPARVDILLNLAPSERQAGSTRLQNETLAALIPTLRVISEMKFSASTLNVSLLDLSRRRVVFHHNNVRALDWDDLKPAFAQASTNTIDVKSLEERGRNAAFFVREVSRTISADVPTGTKHALIVLSGSVAFEAGQDLRPIEATRPSDCPVFYIRFQLPGARLELLNEARRRGTFGTPRGIGVPLPRRRDPVLSNQVSDQLEKTLKPVSPRLFDVETPEQMRKALAEIRAQIESL